MADRHPVLARLDPLIGRWTVKLKVDGMGSGWTEFAWQDDGMYLHQRSGVEPLPTAPKEWREDAPSSTTSVIGLDDASEELTMLYADARGVHRVYRMTLADGVWRIWRNAPGFFQRFHGTFSDDGDTIDARWEMSEDGENWHVDFELTYTR
ncbi:hypothetical protein SAMN05444920_112288 [Nonomuraea solani]|uniref:DUF1579 domain-containing protein n=1 Tax=Nonomuraea solani TaxID=1144553 RepID=A0A1H6EMY2_9ACTN|nr:hypothetical protein [Nonomuraea solani]SEG99208.1 hypothetical protein SAMN05444920_112288 [Nonomuraea solani]